MYRRATDKPQEIEIKTDDGDIIPQLDWSPEMFVDKSVIINGPSNTGKTVIVKNIMKAVSGHIDQILIVNPTEQSNKSYDGFVDSPLIHSRIWLPDPKNPRAKEDGVKGSMRFLEAIWNRQEMLSCMHAKTNDIRLLYAIFVKLPNKHKSQAMSEIKSIAKIGLDAVNSAKKYEQDDAVKIITEKIKKAVASVFKKYITKYKDLLMELDLTADEISVVEYVGINPRVLIIFDDCAPQLRALCNKAIFKQYFFQGRHNFITSIYCIQDDGGLTPEFRKNAFLTFFTTSAVTRAYFGKGANGFSKITQKHVENIIGCFFKAKGDNLAYIRDDPTQKNFYFAKTQIVQPFKFGSKALVSLCKQVKQTTVTIDKENPYYDRFLRRH